MSQFSTHLAPPPSRVTRFRQPLSPLRLSSITEGCELRFNERAMPIPRVSVDADGGGDDIFIRRPSITQRKPDRPLVSILKKQKSVEDDEHDEEDNRFEISVIPYRTSCCRTLVCIEHISDWLHESTSDGHCPSCESPCSLESSTSSTRPRPSPPHTSTEGKPSSPPRPRSFIQSWHAKPPSSTLLAPLTRVTQVSQQKHGETFAAVRTTAV